MMGLRSTRHMEGKFLYAKVSVLSLREEHLGNFNLCTEHRVVGFTRRVGQKGDMVYLAVTVENGTFCSARGLAGEETDIKPWPDADRFRQCFRLETLETCEPFPLSILSGVGRFGAYPHLYFQGGRNA